jgi:hypothetical protein
VRIFGRVCCFRSHIFFIVNYRVHSVINITWVCVSVLIVFAFICTALWNSWFTVNLIHLILVFSGIFPPSKLWSRMWHFQELSLPELWRHFLFPVYELMCSGACLWVAICLIRHAFSPRQLYLDVKYAELLNMSRAEFAQIYRSCSQVGE